MGLMMACPLRRGPPVVLVLAGAAAAPVAAAGLEMVEALLSLVLSGLLNGRY